MNHPYEHNPYHAPSADMDEHYEDYEYNDAPFYARHGRIGRLRYIAYNLVLSFIATPIVAIIALICMGVFGTNSQIGIIVMIILCLPILFYIGFVPMVRRLNDLNRSGWWVLLSFIPYVSVFLYLYLIFAPGNDYVNDYGAPAEPPSTRVKIVAFILPVLAILGILAAIALPAYQDYVLRSQMGY